MSGFLDIQAGTSSALASQAEAEAGTNAVKVMSPLRTAQAIAALAGAGDSTKIVRGAGTVHGYSDFGSAAAIGQTWAEFGTFPAFLGDAGTVTLQTHNDGPVTFTCGHIDPADGTVFFAVSSYTNNPTAFVSAFTSFLQSNYGYMAAFSNDGGTHLYMQGLVEGSSTFASITGTTRTSSFGGQSNGSDSSPPSGEQNNMAFIIPDSGKRLKMIRAFAVANGGTYANSIELGWWDPDTSLFTRISRFIPAETGAVTELLPQNETEIERFTIAAPSAGSMLMVRFDPDGGIPYDSIPYSIYAVVEQS